jgi:exosome complex RNA-binding protein Rrp4
MLILTQQLRRNGKLMENQNDSIEETKETQSQDQMNNMMSDSLDGFKRIRNGEIVHGKIVKADEEGYLVDINYKMEGFLPATEDSLLGINQEKVNHSLEVDDEIDVYVVQVDEKNGQIHLSREKARYILIWDQLINAYKNKKPGTIVDILKDKCIVKTGKGLIGICTLQAPNRKPLPFNEYINGKPMCIDEVFEDFLEDG